MKIKVRVHIGNRSMHRGDAHPYIQIEDVASGIKLGEIEFTAANFGELVAGNGFIEGEMDIVGQRGFGNLGLKKETVQSLIPKDRIPEFKFEDQKFKEKFIEDLMIHSDEFKPEGEGWMVWSNGIQSQQPGDSHRVVYHRYVPDIATGNDEDA